MKVKKQLYCIFVLSIGLIISPVFSEQHQTKSYDSQIINDVKTAVIESDSFRVNKVSYCRDRSKSKTVLWFEDFEDGNLSSKDWQYDVSNGFFDNGKFIYGWGNDELQYYRDAKIGNENFTNDNLLIEDGYLKIQPIFHKRPFRKEFNYTSARIKTQNLRSFTYPSKITFCFKVPTGIGAWPAFWLMPNYKVSWPQGGEIDIMEARGRITNIVSSALHFGNSFFDKDFIVQQVVIPPSLKFQEKFHSITMEWEKNSIKMFLDSESIPYMTIHRDDEAFAEYGYPFNNQYYLIINVAVGGKYDNHLNDRSAFCRNKECTNKAEPDQHRFIIDWIEYESISP
jgi:beta-glucanase (GH16 family)